jgi:hypothetical protein
MDLSKVPTEELRAEVEKRKKAEDEQRRENLRAAYPCPECGEGPREIAGEMVEEFRFAPRDDEGRPMLYAPYEMGTTQGVRYETTVTCVNGHVTRTDEINWFDKPREGPPLLPR